MQSLNYNNNEQFSYAQTDIEAAILKCAYCFQQDRDLLGRKYIIIIYMTLPQ